MWIVKAAGCYLGDRDKLVDDRKDAHKHKYKQRALDHATTYSLFNQWIDGSPINMSVEKVTK